MITPLDIQTRSFSSSAFGYKKQEVDEFQDEILIEYELIYKEYLASQEKIKELSKLLETYKNMEETMKNTLIVAQGSAEQLSASAKKEAEAIINQANQQSQEIINKAIERLNKITSSFEEIKNNVSLFVKRTKSQLQLQIDSLDKVAENIEEKEM